MSLTHMLRHYALCAVVLTLTLLVQGCGGSDPAEVQALTAKNATMNGKNFIAKKLPAADYVEFQSDSSVGVGKCKYGDGWASGTAYTDGGKKVADLKCSTTGSSKGFGGCFTQEEFETKAVYLNQDGQCDKTIKKMVDLSQK